MESLQMLMQHPAHVDAKRRQQQCLAGYQVIIADCIWPCGARRVLFEGIVVEALNIKTSLSSWRFCSICVALNTLVDVVAVFATHRLLKSEAARAARACI